MDFYLHSSSVCFLSWCALILPSFSTFHNCTRRCFKRSVLHALLRFTLLRESHGDAPFTSRQCFMLCKARLHASRRCFMLLCALQGVTSRSPRQCFMLRALQDVAACSSRHCFLLRAQHAPSFKPPLLVIYNVHS